MVFNPRFGNQSLSKHFSTQFAIKDQWGEIAKRTNNSSVARTIAKRLSLKHRGITFSVWSGKGFTLKLNLTYTGGRRGR